MANTNRSESRRYPIGCTSAYCAASGEDCSEICHNYAALQEFYKWRDSEPKAVQVSPIWDQNLYVKTIKEAHDD